MHILLTAIPLYCLLDLILAGSVQGKEASKPTWYSSLHGSYIQRLVAEKKPTKSRALIGTTLTLSYGITYL